MHVVPTPEIVRQVTNPAPAKGRGGNFAPVAPVEPVTAVPATQDDVLQFRHDQLMQQNMRAPAAYLAQQIAQMTPGGADHSMNAAVTIYAAQSDATDGARSNSGGSILI